MPDADRVRAVEDAHLHDYEKSPRAGRKLGHLTAAADTPGEREKLAKALVALVEG
jgi:5-(carboxyamino)imidazole ribonucleotide synthase